MESVGASQLDLVDGISSESIAVTVSCVRYIDHKAL